MRSHLICTAAVRVCVLLACAAVCSCGGGRAPGVSLTQVVVSPASKTIAKGTSLHLSATALFSNGTSEPLGSAVTWQVTPAGVATVTAEGKLAGVEKGVAQVTASYQGTSGNAAITVGPAALSSIVVTSSQASVPLGEFAPLTATGIYTDGSRQVLTSLAIWQVSPSNLGTVSGQGQFETRAQGQASITASYNKVSGNASVAVGPAVLQRIAVSARQSTLALGTSEALAATGFFSDGSSRDITPSVTWNAGPSSVAQIDSQGNLKGLARGVAQVSATSQSISGSAAVSVGPASLVSIGVVVPQASLPLGQSEMFVAIGTFSDGTTQNIGPQVTWSSTNPKIASVDPTGSVKGNSKGGAIITAANGSLLGNASLAVSEATIAGISVNPVQNSVTLGGNVQLQAIASMSDGSTQDVTTTATWSSRAPTIVSVNNTGQAASARIGTAIIEASQGSMSGTATVTVTPLMLASYFNLANAISSGYDGTLQLVDPGLIPGDMCAMIYVFDRNQEMNECCGCKISDNGILTLSLIKNLTGNTLTANQPVAGDIEIIPSDLGPGGSCNAGTPTPDGMLAGWQTNIQSSLQQYQVTEVPYTVVPLTSIEEQVLTNDCSLIQTLGSGAGVCSCGTGD